MNIIQPTSFKKDVKRQKKRGKDLEKLKDIIELLVSGIDLPERCFDHAFPI